MMSMDAFKGMTCPKCGGSRMASRCYETEWISDDLIWAEGEVECADCRWIANYSQTLHTVEKGIEIYEEDE